MNFIKERILILGLFILGFISGCTKTTTIDKVIDKYENDDFSKLKNKSIQYRSAGKKSGSSIILITTFSGKCAPYIVEYNKKNNEILNINDDLVIRSCGEDYFTDEDITATILEYSKYNLSLISVDSIGNVYINPDKQEAPVLLRKKLSSETEKNYKHYKGNWFIKE